MLGADTHTHTDNNNNRNIHTTTGKHTHTHWIKTDTHFACTVSRQGRVK